jgi:hypothetical protein
MFLGGFSVFCSWCIREKEIAPMSETAKEPTRFFAFVTNQIEPQDGYESALAGFPLNILFAAVTNDARTGQQSVVDVCYEPAPETFREDSRQKALRYFTKRKNGYSIRVTFEKGTGGWGTEKFKGKKLVRSAEGSTFEQTMIHTTMDGPEPDER